MSQRLSHYPIKLLHFELKVCRVSDPEKQHQLLLTGFTYLHTCGLEGVKFPLKPFCKALSPSFSTLPVIPVNSDNILVKQKSLELSAFMSSWVGIIPASYKTVFLLGMASSFFFKVSETSLTKASCPDDFSRFSEDFLQLKRFAKAWFSLVCTMKKFGILHFFSAYTRHPWEFHVPWKGVSPLG